LDTKMLSAFASYLVPGIWCLVFSEDQLFDLPSVQCAVDPLSVMFIAIESA
jgi:hypothetical protein